MGWCSMVGGGSSGVCRWCLSFLVSLSGEFFLRQFIFSLLLFFLFPGYVFTPSRFIFRYRCVFMLHFSFPICRILILPVYSFLDIPLPLPVLFNVICQYFLLYFILPFFSVPLFRYLSHIFTHLTLFFCNEDVKCDNLNANIYESEGFVVSCHWVHSYCHVVCASFLLTA